MLLLFSDWFVWWFSFEFSCQDFRKVEKWMQRLELLLNFGILPCLNMFFNWILLLCLGLLFYFLVASLAGEVYYCFCNFHVMQISWYNPTNLCFLYLLFLIWCSYIQRGHKFTKSLILTVFWIYFANGFLWIVYSMRSHLAWIAVINNIKYKQKTPAE